MAIPGPPGDLDARLRGRDVSDCSPIAKHSPSWPRRRPSRHFASRTTKVKPRELASPPPHPDRMWGRHHGVTEWTWACPEHPAVRKSFRLRTCASRAADQSTRWHPVRDGSSGRSPRTTIGGGPRVVRDLATTVGGWPRVVCDRASLDGMAGGITGRAGAVPVGAFALDSHARACPTAVRLRSAPGLWIDCPNRCAAADFGECTRARAQLGRGPHLPPLMRPRPSEARAGVLPARKRMTGQDPG